MIDTNTLCFPNNIVNVIAIRAKQIIDPVPDDLNVIKRPVDTMDPDQTLAIIPASWAPTGSPEIASRTNQFENTIQSYTIMIQALVNDMSEEVAIARHSLFSTLIRRMLYRDPVLMGALTQLRVEVDGVVESTTKYGVRSQQFLVNPKDGSFQYLSIIEFYLETQIQ